MADPYRVGGNYNGVKTKAEQRQEKRAAFREWAAGYLKNAGSEIAEMAVLKWNQGRDELAKAINHGADPYLPWPDHAQQQQPDAPDMGGVHGPETKPEAKVAPTATHSSSVDAYLSGNYPKAGVEQGKHDANLGIESLDDYAASRGMSAEISQPRKRGMSR